jgi:hypothetical protein
MSVGHIRVHFTDSLRSCGGAMGWRDRGTSTMVSADQSDDSGFDIQCYSA